MQLQVFLTMCTKFSGFSFLENDDEGYHTGSSELSASNFGKVEVRPSRKLFTFHSYTDLIQFFWYTKQL